jgi:quercetin dioxygenase-like cupin family protein
MNIKAVHTQDKAVSAVSLFKSDQGNATAIQILQGEKLKEHSTKIPALLVCVDGEVVFENEKGAKEILKSGDYINIEPLVIHWVIGIKQSQLILIK